MGTVSYAQMTAPKELHLQEENFIKGDKTTLIKILQDAIGQIANSNNFKQAVLSAISALVALINDA